MDKALPGLSLVIPTYRGEQVLLDTIRRVHDLDPAPDEILVVDQTQDHEPATEEALRHLHDEGWVRWVRLPRPSIPHAMNTGLLEARHELVLFTDDDVVPDRKLVAAHLAAHKDPEASVVFLGRNVSMQRDGALAVGGFDENFVGAASRCEDEFSERLLRSGRHIRHEPTAIGDHLKADGGGNVRHARPRLGPGDVVGEYYHLRRTRSLTGFLGGSALRFGRSVFSRRNLRAPWLIPVTLLAEMVAFFWALGLAARGPRLVNV